MPDPKKNTAFVFSLSLGDSASRPQFRANPTLAAGDFKVSIDDGAFNNLATLPTVAPAAGRNVRVALSAAEMNGDRIVVQAVDAAGAEWDEVMVAIQTTVSTTDEIKTETASIQADTNDIQTRLPAALVSGRMDSSVGAMAANSVTSSALDASATNEIADGVWDEAIAGHLTAGSTGAALNAAGGAGDPWITPLPGAYAAGQAGFIVGTNLNATVSSRATQTSVDNVQADTDNIQTRLPAALVGGNMPVSLTAAGLATDAVDEIRDGVLAGVVETGATVRESLRLANAANAGKVNGLATPTVHLRDLADTKNRVTASVDGDGNRTAITLDLT